MARIIDTPEYYRNNSKFSSKGTDDTGVSFDYDGMHPYVETWQGGISLRVLLTPEQVAGLKDALEFYGSTIAKRESSDVGR